MARERNPPSSWWGWGDPEQVPVLPEEVRQLLAEGLRVQAPGRPPPALEAIALPASRLSGDALAPHGLDTTSEARIRHMRGKSTPDLLRLRAGDLAGVPDGVATPASHEQVLDVLRICSRRRIAVVPFGGGTSVVGGLEPEAAGFAAVLALDLGRMAALVTVDEQSRLAVLEPGLRGPEAEELLSQRGFTIGHFPQSFEYATLGGFAATRSSGQASAGYGRFDDLVLALRVATPAGTLTLGRAPKSAAGPDLRQLVLGSEGALGVITSLTVQLRPAPERRVYEGWRLPSFADGLAATRRLAQDGPVPTVLRLSDEAETAVSLALPSQPAPAGSASGGCLAIVGFEGRATDVAWRRELVSEVFGNAGAEADADAGEAWVRDRYRGPYVRDALLNAGVLVETLETATFWSSVDELYRSVSRALRDALSAQGTPPVVLCHVSHVYPAGASLYFTVVCAQAPDPLAQWHAAKRAASDAVLTGGGTISHHHGIGRDHRSWYAREVGELGVRAVAAVKAELDPAGILNPGVLVGAQ